MAEEIDPNKVYYDDHQADKRSVFEDIESGLRKDPIQGCQYFIKGLSGLCKYWVATDDGVCNYSETIAEEEGVEASKVSPPSGYNGSKCDYLGRRYSCDKYKCKTRINEDTGETELDENLDEYWCVAPNMFLSGLGSRTKDGSGAPLLSPIPKSEIPGYCEGKCDEQGRGTGCEGVPGSTPIICSYYRPFQMGFGADEPHQLTYKYVRGKKIITEKDMKKAYDAAGDPLGSRLPFSFKLYNLRAYMQKCANWDSDYGSRFEVDTTAFGANIKLDIDSTPLAMCTSTEEASKSYVTYATVAPGGITAWLLKDVWSQANTVICNGAKPECPCYTGKWNYVTDELMAEGMRITALQAFELRFWTSDWGSKKEYDAFFTEIPNFQDAARSDIYTYTSIERGATPADSTIQGNKNTMCVPAPLDQREFTEDYVEVSAHTYPKLGKDPGTTVPVKKQIYYPNLIRDPDVTSAYIRPLDIIYPYHSSDPFSEDKCEDRDDPLCVKRGCLMENDSITVIGSTIRRCEVYAINTSVFTEEVYSILPELVDNWSANTISNIRKFTGTNDLYDGFSDREKFFMHIPDFIDECKKKDVDFVMEGASDDDGVFILGPIPIENQQKSTITIFVKFSDGTWDFRQRPVWLQWYGGTVVQTRFTNEPESGSVVGLPGWFNGAEITGKMIPFSPAPYRSTPDLKCNAAELIPFGGSAEYYDSEFQLRRKYGYCIKKVTVTDSVIETWGRIGNAGLVWVDIIEDTNINHIFEWDIDSATMVFDDDEEEVEGAEEGGKDATDSTPTCRDSNEIEMEVQEVETFVSGDSSIPPTARILKPKDTTKKFGFFNSEVTLKVTYWYKIFSNTDELQDLGFSVTLGAMSEEIDSPDFENDYISFRSYRYTFRQSGREFYISKLRWDTAALMGNFNSEEGRLISCIATKMLTQVVTVDCRNVDIIYNYTAEATGWRLMPDSGLAVKPTGLIQIEISPFGYQPPCGDHEVSRVWFPFSSCAQTGFYQEYAGGSYCTAPFPDTPRDDMRLCVPPLYKAWVGAGGSSAYADCGLYFKYRYGKGKTPSQCLWAGHGRIVYYVDLVVYAVEGWTPPPFGNKGREFVERYLSSDYHHHLTEKGVIKPTPTTKYVPLVPDFDSFYFSFNAFDQVGVNNLEPFSYISQINFFMSNLIGETMEEDRLNWDEMFNERVMTKTTYPPPLIPDDLIVKVAHYSFKDKETAWAWKENWKDLEIVDEKQLYFVRYEKPDYYYDSYKVEHRYICDEGEYTIYYKAPIIEESKLKTYPSLRLDGKERYFEIRYDDYNSEYIDWKDEDSGEVGGSGGDDDGEGRGKIYERTSGPEWNHDVNILFDSDAVETTEAAEEAGREVEIGGETFYYNRGLIVNIKKNILNHLPYNEDEEMPNTEIDAARVDPDFMEEPEVEKLNIPEDIDRVWYNESFSITYGDTYEKEIEEGDDAYEEEAGEGGNTETVSVSAKGGCISKIEIRGKWGVYTPDEASISEIKGALGVVDDSSFVEKTGTKQTIKYQVCKPGITVRRIFEGGEETLYELSKVEYDVKLYPKLGLVNFKLELPLEVSVNRMFYKPDTSLVIDFTCVENQFVFLGEKSIKLYIARYTEPDDTINVYERKYVRSTAEESNFGSVNINGPKQGGASNPLQRELQDDNSGSYFASSPAFDYGYKGVTQARDKLRGFYGSEQKTEDEDIDINMSTLLTVEETEQMLLYNDAIYADVDGDTWNYTLICPPPLADFLKKYEISGAGLINGSIDFVSKKQKWDDHILAQDYRELKGKALWQPKGHKFKWSDKVVRRWCYEIILTTGSVDWTTVTKVYTVVKALYEHLDTAVTEVTHDPYTALYGNRVWYQTEVIANLTGYPPIIEGGIFGAAGTFQDAPLVGQDQQLTDPFTSAGLQRRLTSEETYNIVDMYGITE